MNDDTNLENAIDEMDNEAMTDEEKRSMGYVDEKPKENGEAIPEETQEEKPKENDVKPVVEEKPKPTTDEIGSALSKRNVEEEKKKIKENVELKTKVENMELKYEYERATNGMSAEEIEIIAPVISELISDGTVDAMLSQGKDISRIVEDTLATARGKNIDAIVKAKTRAREVKKEIEQISSFKQKTGEGSSENQKDAIFKEAMSGDRDALVEMIKDDDEF